jgi:hypothetical protein
MMKGIVRNTSFNLRMHFAFFALSTLFAQHDYAQKKQVLTQSESSALERCGADQLSLQNTGEVISMGAMRFIEFIFTNTSSSACTLEGYPRFQFLNKSGRVVRRGLAANGVTFRSLYTIPPQLAVMKVTVEPGKKAKFVINYLGRYDEDREKPCPTYRKAQVTGPGIKRVFVQKFGSDAIEVCSGLTISPVFAASKYDY